jgi:sn-glycerol 3-phosphate transport system substrate-binding protein
MKLHATTALALLAATAALPASAQPIKFEMWYGLTGQLGELTEETCKRFNKAQTKYEAVCVGQGGYDKAEQNTIAAYRAKKHPTVVQIYDAGTVNFMLSGAVKPAVEFAKENDMKIDWANYVPGIASYYATSKGEMWSFPFNSSSALMYWNKADFAKIGKSAAPKTFEEMERDLRALKAAGHACPFTFDFDTWQMMEQFSAVHGIPVATQNNGYDGLNAEVTFNKTKFADHVKTYKRWFDEGLAKINTAQTGKTILQAFTDGSCASMLTSVANHGVVGSTARQGLDWDVAFLPVYEGTQRKNSLIGGASLWIMEGKSKPEYVGAAAYIAFLLTPESEEWFSTVTGYIPITKSGFNYLVDKGFYTKAPFKGREVAMQQLTASEITPVTRGIRLGNFTSIRAEIRSELEAAFTGKKDVQTALDDAAARSNQILRRFEQTFTGKKLP